MFLHQPRQSVEIARAGMGREGLPFCRSGTRRANGSVNVSGTALSDDSQFLAVRRIERVEIFSGRRRLPRSADEESKAPPMALQPCSRLFGIFRSGSVLHREKFFGDAHSVGSRIFV